MRHIPISGTEGAFHRASFWAIGILIGFGPWVPATLLLAPLVAVYSFRVVPTLRIELRSLVLLLLLLGLIISFQITTDGVLPAIDVVKAYMYYYTVTLMALSISTRDRATTFLFSISSGMLLHAGFVFLATVMTLDPPYYGRVFSPFNGEIVNSPEASNFAGMYAVTFIACLSGSIRLFEGRGWWVLAAVGLIVSLMIGVILAGRTYFLISLGTVLFFLLRILRSRKGLGIFLFLCFSLLVLDIILDFSTLTYSIGREETVGRFKEQGTNSIRYELQAYWIDNFLQNPFRPILLGFSETMWFHNFWMDLHSDAGFVPFMFSILMLATSSIHCIFMFYNDRDTFFTWFPVFVSTLFVLSSTVSDVVYPLYFFSVFQMFIFTKFGVGSSEPLLVRLR